MKKLLNFLLTLITIAVLAYVGYFAVTKIEANRNLTTTKITSTTSTSSASPIQKAMALADAKGQEYIAQAKSLNPYQSSVVTLNSVNKPSSALLYAPTTSDHYDDVLQVYVASPNLIGDTNKAIQLWNAGAGKTVAKSVTKPENADVIVSYASDEKKLDFPAGKGGITFYNEEGSLGKNSYILVADDLSGTTASQDTIVAHEIGHALGIAHREPDDSSQANTDGNFDLMNTIVGNRTPYSLSEYDLLALKAAEEYWPLAYQNYLK
ncbi:MAG: hypothetical protein LBM27_01070 [Lactobacillaceae bacterium]|jgi:hypothetical protein|nr:hypothetical protein [Lactobacillaceae bacterium]